MMIEKARALAKYTESLAATEHWGVDDQDTLEWLINEVQKLRGIMQNDILSVCEDCVELKVQTDGLAAAIKTVVESALGAEPKAG